MNGDGGAPRELQALIHSARHVVLDLHVLATFGETWREDDALIFAPPELAARQLLKMGRFVQDHRCGLVRILGLDEGVRQIERVTLQVRADVHLDTIKVTIGLNETVDIIKCLGQLYQYQVGS